MQKALLMKNVVQDYDWGHSDYIKNFLGGADDIPSPQAELWMGSHPKAPSCLVTPEGLRGLDKAIIADPREWLGPDALAAGWKDLPFLFKVLAAGKPLSIQCHPSLESARAGFRRENEAGVPLGAAHRNYKDPNHKPEIICALTPFAGLCGFRPMKDIAADFRALGDVSSGLVSDVAADLAATAESGDGKALVRAILEQRERQDILAAGLVAFCSGRKEARFAFLSRAAASFPGDIGLFFFLVLELVQLAPGEGIFIPAGVLHAYVDGVGLEVMANSDNVLRGGLTPKHIDIPELLANLDPSIKVEVLKPAKGGNLTEYRAPVPEFRLQSIRAEGPVELPRNGSPEILLCVRGTLQAGGLSLVRGQSAYLLPGREPLSLEVHGECARVFIPLE